MSSPWHYSRILYGSTAPENECRLTRSVVAAIFDSLDAASSSDCNPVPSLHLNSLTFLSRILESNPCAADFLQKEGIWSKLYGPHMFWLGSAQHMNPSAASAIHQNSTSSQKTRSGGDPSADLSVRIGIASGGDAIELVLEYPGVDTGWLLKGFTPSSRQYWLKPWLLSSRVVVASICNLM